MPVNPAVKRFEKYKMEASPTALTLLVAKKLKLDVCLYAGNVWLTKDNKPHAVFDLLTNTAWLPVLLNKFLLCRDYEPYDQMGFSWFIYDAEDPIRSLEYSYNRTPSEITPMHACCEAIWIAEYGTESFTCI